MLLRIIGGLVSIAAKAEPYILKIVSPAYKVGIALKENTIPALKKRATVEASAEEGKDKTKPALGNKKASAKKTNTVSKKSKTSIRKKRKNFVNVLKKVSPDAVKAKISKKDLKDKNVGFKEILLSGKDNFDASQSEQDLFEAIGSMRKARQSRRLIDVLESALKDSLGEIGSEYNEGKLSAKEFKSKAKDALKGFHVASMIVGAGGIKNLSQDNLTSLTETLEKQYKYFDRFAEKKLGLTTGINTRGSKEHRISAKNMSSLRAYASSIKGSYEIAEAQVMSASEYEVEERRVATASESCEDCFIGDTFISCENGIKKIKDITTKDKVYTHTKSLKPVYKLISKRTKTLFEIKVGDHIVLCTGNHPFLLKNGTWKKARYLTLDDELMLFENHLNIFPQKIDRIKKIRLKKYIDVYNIEVEDDHSYIANSIIAHNCISYASEGWQPLGTLAEIGDSQCGIYCKCYFEYRDRKRKK